MFVTAVLVGAVGAVAAARGLTPQPVFCAQALFDDAARRAAHIAHHATLLLNLYATSCCARGQPLPKLDQSLHGTACRLVSDNGGAARVPGAAQPALCAFYHEQFAPLHGRARPPSHGLQQAIDSMAIEAGPPRRAAPPHVTDARRFVCALPTA